MHGDADVHRTLNQGPSDAKGEIDLLRRLGSSRKRALTHASHVGYLTTNTRVAGQAEADFASERLHLRFVPGHKSPRLFSFAVPVEVRGTFDDYHIALRPAPSFWHAARSSPPTPRADPCRRGA